MGRQASGSTDDPGASPAAALRRRLAVQRDRLREDLSLVADLRAVASHRAAIEPLTDDLDRQVERLPRAAVITLVGATGAGKSTLLNALADLRLALGPDEPMPRLEGRYTWMDQRVLATVRARWS